MKLKVARTKVGRVLCFQEFDVRPQSVISRDFAYQALPFFFSVHATLKNWVGPGDDANSYVHVHV